MRGRKIDHILGNKNKSWFGLDSAGRLKPGTTLSLIANDGENWEGGRRVATWIWRFALLIIISIEIKIGAYSVEVATPFDIDQRLFALVAAV